MKKIISFGLLVAVMLSCSFLVPSFAKKHGGKTSSVSSITATITGNVTLLAKRKGFPTDLATIYAGNDSAVTFNKIGKKINVTGTYTGGSLVTVGEASTTENSDTYRFLIPANKSILETFSSTQSRDVQKTGVVRAVFGDFSKTMSVSNVVTSRNGNKGKLTGTFNKGASAQGRFTLNFTFSE